MAERFILAVLVVVVVVPVLGVGVLHRWGLSGLSGLLAGGDEFFVVRRGPWVLEGSLVAGHRYEAVSKEMVGAFG